MVADFFGPMEHRKCMLVDLSRTDNVLGILTDSFQVVVTFIAWFRKKIFSFGERFDFQ